ncbi:Ig-like domain-containing protein, partial [Novosphingobium sp. KCTC 2891]|uniref:Ig-like domain-containing protein n=1 Tax=Novosphingobium sp. KCTC 2891 TaxID=2989730 RepID=UPI002223615E
AVEIEGVSGGATPRTVFDLTLNDVAVSSVSSGDSAGGESSIQASFGYSRIGLVTTSQNADGSLGAQQSFGWDIAANKAIDPATLTAPTNTFAGEVPDPVTYYIKIDGIAGDSVSKDHKGWFEVSSYQLGANNTASLFGGAGAGKAEFSDLNIALAGTTALTALLASSAAGKHIAAVEIEGVSGGATPSTVFDLTLNDVLVSSVNSGTGGGDGALSTSVSFGYSRIGLVTTEQNPDGSPGDRYEFGWDLATAKVIDPDLLAIPDDRAPLVAIGSLELASDTGASAQDLVTRDGHVTLTGTASDDVSVASVHILDGTTDLGAATLVGTNWTFSAELAPGTHVLTAVATDSGGQTASTAAQPAIVVDVAAPSLTVVSEVLTNDAGASPSDFITNDGRFTLAGAVSDNLTAVGVHVFDGTTDLGAATVLDGGWSFSGTLLAGTHHLSAVAVDLAGNSTSVDAAQDITVDATAPTVATSFQHLLIDTGSSSTDGITSDGRISLGGTAADNLALASVHVFDGVTDLGAASVVNGNWSFETVLGAGTHALVAVAYDVAGNHTASLPQASVTVVPQAPIVGNPLQAVVHGTSGAETIVFGTNNRIVIGGNGNDVFAIAGGSSFAGHMVVGGGGTDTLDLSSLGSPLNVRLGGGLAIGSGLGQFFALSVENVIGGSGNDTLGASNSVNTLTGGRGADIFVYASLNDARNPGAPAGAANDTITDFHEAALFPAGQRDVIDLRGIDAVLGGRDDAFAFVTSPWNGAGNAFTAAGQIRYQYVVDSAGQEHTLISGNVDRIGQGNGLAADFVIDLIGHHQLAAADFLL